MNTTTGLLLRGNDLYLSKSFLKAYMSVKTIEHWRTNHVGYQEVIDGEFYILYKSIPFRSRKNLPSEKTIRFILKENEQESKTEFLSKNLEKAYYLHYAKYLSTYEADSKLPTEKVTHFARLHAVFQAIIDLKENEGLRDLKNLYEAFNQLYPSKYTSKHALSKAVKDAMRGGAMCAALDGRVFGNNREHNSKKFTPLQKFWLAYLVGQPRKLTNGKIWEALCKLCEQTGHQKPSLSWVKKWRLALLKNPELYSSRYGQQQASKQMPYASLKHGEHANDQWQMDGWTLPFWGAGGKGFKRYVLVRLIDSNSKKVIGYSFGESENSTVIMEAIKDAISSTGLLPFEIVTDNHAFNKTEEAKNIIRLFKKKGCRWTVTQNPQHKAIVERYNQHLDTLCRDYYGYLGQGIQSKSIDALASPEMAEQYSKNFLSKEEIRGIAVAVVETYNKTPQKDTKSPMQRYEEKANPHPIKVSVYDRAELLSSQASKKIIRGQITIERGSIKHEFQLPAELFQQYNNTTVTVRYDDLKDGVYLFEAKNGEAIGFLPPKGKIHAAIINQNDEDKQAFFRHKGRLTGIKTKARTDLEILSEKAHAIDPEAHERVNRMATPKDVLQQMEQDANLRRTAEDKGLKMEMLYVPNRPLNIGTPALKPKEKKKDQPFTVKNHTISIIDPFKPASND